MYQIEVLFVTEKHVLVLDNNKEHDTILVKNRKKDKHLLQ